MSKQLYFRTVPIKERLPNLGQRVMFLDTLYERGFMVDYNPTEKIEIKKGKYIEMMECHFVTDYLIKNYSHWLEEIEL